MKHTPVAEISRVADVHPVPLKPPLTRVERLGRWAEALEREPDRVLTSLEEIEWKSEAERRDMRTDRSALTVAFEDPVLRADGLASDRLGDATARTEAAAVQVAPVGPAVPLNARRYLQHLHRS